VFVTTVDKDAGHDAGSDIDAVLAPYLSTAAFDRADRVEAYAPRPDPAYRLLAFSRTTAS
jgi:hypothetical protein